MSATFKNAKKKLIQSEFRKCLTEHKEKNKRDVKQIDSPLAKYNSKGELTCILCSSVVRSAAVWTVHVNSKQHKESVEKAKRLKLKATKRSASPTAGSDEPPQKSLKGILKNSNAKPSEIKSADTNTNTNTTSSSIEVPVPVAIKDEQPIGNNRLPSDFFETGTKNEDHAVQASAEKQVSESDLPEGFFDDPKLDAKARKQEYKDPVEEEWEKFQKAIKEADDESAAIIAGDQEEATSERTIELIDEDIKNFSKVLDFVKKKPDIKATVTNKVDDSMDYEIDEDGIDEYIDWRSKSLFN